MRGRGLLLAVELAHAPAASVAGSLRERGVLVNAITPTALRLCPPLCLSHGEADTFMVALAATLAGAAIAGVAR